MPNLNQNPELLKNVLIKEESLRLARQSLFTFAEEIKGFDKKSEAYKTGYKTLVESVYILSKQFYELAVLKAQVGIVGDQWYNHKV